MGVLIVIALVVAVIVVVGMIGDWIDAKTGFVFGAIIAGCVSIYLMGGMRQAFDDSIKPTPIPICRQVGTC